MIDSLRVHGPIPSQTGESLLAFGGVLDSASYRTVRDTVVKAALDEPRVVIVDVSDLLAPAASAWSVFTSARWQVSTWPDVPIVLVCEPDDRRQAIRRVGITRYVPVYASSQEALLACAEEQHRRRWRARTQLADEQESVVRARNLVKGWLTGWACPELIPLANIIATVFVENALAHTDSAPALIVEYDGQQLTVAVEDHSHVPAQRSEDPDRGANLVSGLAIVAALAKAWGSAPSLTGKTVWAVMGPENRL